MFIYYVKQKYIKMVYNCLHALMDMMWPNHSSLLFVIES